MGGLRKVAKVRDLGVEGAVECAHANFVLVADIEKSEGSFFVQPLFELSGRNLWGWVVGVVFFKSSFSLVNTLHLPSYFKSYAVQCTFVLNFIYCMNSQPSVLNFPVFLLHLLAHSTSSNEMKNPLNLPFKPFNLTAPPLEETKSYYLMDHVYKRPFLLSKASFLSWCLA